jgi:hypothetical protein
LAKNDMPITSRNTTDQRDRVDQHVDAFQGAQFADEQEVGRIRARLDRHELRGGDAVVHHAHERTRLSDLGAERVAAIGALEQQQVGAPHQHAFKREIEQADRRDPAIVQAAAVRRVDPDRMVLLRQAGICAALGAVAVHDVGTRIGHALRHVGNGIEVAQIDVAAHRQPGQAKGEVAREIGQNCVRGGTACHRVGDDADLVTQRGLAAREIDHVAEQSADRRAQNVEDFQRVRRC